MTKNTHQYSEAQIKFLSEHLDDSIPELTKAFRTRFGRHVRDLTDNAIKNRRYHLRNKMRSA